MHFRCGRPDFFRSSQFANSAFGLAGFRECESQFVVNFVARRIEPRCSLQQLDGGAPLLETFIGNTCGVIALIVERLTLDILPQRGDRIRKVLLRDEGATDSETGFVLVGIEPQGFLKLDDCCFGTRRLGSGFEGSEAQMGFRRIRVRGHELLQRFYGFRRLSSL